MTTLAILLPVCCVLCGHSSASAAERPNIVVILADDFGYGSVGCYGDFIDDLDLSVGRILKTLDQSQLADDTLVIFTSDNGGVVAEKSKSGSQKVAMDAGLTICGSWRGGKHDVWEGGFRVPFIVRWPGHVAPGSTNDVASQYPEVVKRLSRLLDEQQARGSSRAK